MVRKSSKQNFEGKINICRGEKCEFSCCDEDQVEEWIIEYLAFHDRLKDFLKKQGIGINFVGDRVFFTNCSDGHKCKFLKYSLNKDIDPRPIDCKIYPFVVDWKSIDFDKKIINLYYWDNTCPLIKKGIPESFKKSVINILNRDFSYLFHGTQFEINFIDELFPEHRKKIKKN